MRFVLAVGFLVTLVWVGCAGGTPNTEKDAADGRAVTRRHGYVLKRGEGEILGSDIIKASPSSGTSGSVMILQPMPGGFSTGLHVHLEADELFYAVSGRGMVTLDKRDFVVEAGDVFFAPAGMEHKVFVAEGSQLEVLEFLDKPGVDEEFRVWHRRFSQNPAELTLEELNAVARKYGTVYRTLK